MRGDNQVELDPFDVTSIKAGERIVIVGKSNSGKSTKIEWIMRHLGNIIPKGFVMTGSFTNGDYQWVPGLYRHDGYSAETIADVCYVQECKAVEARMDPTLDPNIWFILDDLSDDQKVMKDQYLKQLFSKGRHRKIATIVMCQYFRDLPKALRPNIDYLIMLGDKSPDNRKGIYNQYISCVQPANFNKIFDTCTMNYGALVFRNNANGNAASDCFAYLRIPDKEFEADPRDPKKQRLRPFQIGSDTYRDYSARHFRDAAQEKMEAMVQAKKRKRDRVARKLERMQKLALGERVEQLVSTIGSDQRSSMLTSNSALHSEPVLVGNLSYPTVGGGGGGDGDGGDAFGYATSFPHIRQIDDFSVHGDDDAACDAAAADVCGADESTAAAAAADRLESSRWNASARSF